MNIKTSFMIAVVFAGLALSCNNNVNNTTPDTQTDTTGILNRTSRFSIPETNS